MSSSTDSDTVSAYSRFGAQEYEDPANRQFLYGAMTVEFLNTISLRPDDRVVVDLGAGTGFVFEELGDQFRGGDRKGVGIEPAAGMRAIAEEKFAGDKAFRYAPVRSSRSRCRTTLPIPSFRRWLCIGSRPCHPPPRKWTAYFAMTAGFAYS